MSRPIISDEFEDKFYEKITSKDNTRHTANRYLREASKFEGWLQAERGKTLLEASASDLRVHLDGMGAKNKDGESYAPSTIKQRRAGVSSFYQKAMEIEEDYNGIIEEVPANPSEGLDQNWTIGTTKKSEGLDAEEGIYYLNPDEIRQLDEYAPAPKLRNRLGIRLLFNTGLRRDELAKVTIDAIDRGNQTIRIPPMKSPKPRTVTYDEEYVGRLLSRWLDNGHRKATFGYRELDSPYLFPTDSTEHIDGYTVNEIVKKAADKAGLQKSVATYVDGRDMKKYTAHSIRHSYAVQAIKSGIDIRSLSKLMGHKELDTTMIYLRIEESDSVEASRDFKPFGEAE